MECEIDMEEKCVHDLKTLSEPVVDLELNMFGGSCYVCPPIFQCVKCKKVFKTGYNEWDLIEMPIKTIEELEKEESEYVPGKKKVSIPIFLLILIIGGVSIILIMLILLLMS